MDSGTIIRCHASEIDSLTRIHFITLDVTYEMTRRNRGRGREGKYRVISNAIVMTAFEAGVNTSDVTSSSMLLFVMRDIPNHMILIKTSRI